MSNQRLPGREGPFPPERFLALTDATDARFESTRYIWVGGTGNVELIGMEDTAPVVFTEVPAGTKIEGNFQMVVGSGTTATKLVAAR